MGLFSFGGSDKSRNSTWELKKTFGSFAELEEQKSESGLANVEQVMPVAQHPEQQSQDVPPLLGLQTSESLRKTGLT